MRYGQSSNGVVIANGTFLLPIFQRVAASGPVTRFLAKFGLGVVADQATGGVLSKHLLGTLKFWYDAANGNLRDRAEKFYAELHAEGKSDADILVFMSTAFPGWMRDPPQGPI